MSANVDSMFSVREVPWHGLGEIVEEYPGSWAEARKLAGLEWEPQEEDQYRLVGMNPDGTPKFETIPGYKLITRSDNGLILDSANRTYELISHAKMGEIVEAILDHQEVKYETAGSLDEGRKVWALAKLGDPIELKGDNSATLRYMALMNSHDGTSALKVVGTGVRVVCQNTWHAADVLAEKQGTAYSFRHTKNWKNKVEEAKLAIQGAYAQMDKYIERARQLLTVRVTSEQTEEFIRAYAIERTILNTDVKRANLEDHLKTNPRVAESMAHTVATMRKILGSETCAEIETTAYGLLQAAGEFADHFRPYQSKDTYFTRTMVNTEPLKKVATKLVGALA